MAFTISFILGACIIPGIAAAIVWFVTEKNKHRILITIGTFVLVLAICILTRYLLSSTNDSSQANKEVTQGSTTVAKETTTEVKPAYATLGALRINITDTNYKRIKSYKNFNFSHQTEETNEDEESVWKDYSDKEKKRIWNAVTKIEGSNADFAVYQDRISSNVFTLHKINTNDTAYATIDDFLADLKPDSDSIFKEKHIDIDGVHGYTMFETYDEENITETILIYRGNSYIVTVRPFYLSTDLEKETNKIVSKISLK